MHLQRFKIVDLRWIPSANLGNPDSEALAFAPSSFSNIVFFPYHAQSKIIVYAWVNDEDTKRAFESWNNAYRAFNKMLKNGRPPDDWDNLMAEAKLDAARLQAFIEQS